MLGIVNKPQFDTDVFKVGKAIHIKKYAQSNGYKLVDADAIILHSKPLAIVVAYVKINESDIDDSDEMTLVIPIEEVVEEEVEITELKEEK